MGKKSKKNHANKGKTSNTKTQQQSASSATQQRTINNEGPGSSDAACPLNSGNSSMVSIYKSATEEVLQWARSEYQKLSGIRKKRKSSFTTLVSLFATCFQSLVEAQIRMPISIQSSLHTAIEYRKRVSDIYRLVLSASEVSYQRHQWIIDQLGKVAQNFCKLDNDHAAFDKDSADKVNAKRNSDNPFEALSVEVDDEEDDHADETDHHPLSKQEEPKFPSTTKVAIPTAEEIATEEKCFAISLVLLEISEAREDVRRLWRQWASAGSQREKFNSSDDGAMDDSEAVGELVAATACTEYIIQALRKLVLQTTIEYQCFNDFDVLLEAMSESNARNDTNSQEPMNNKTDYEVGDSVVLQNLVGRIDLNGREGTINKPKAGERFAVKLFALENEQKRQIIAVKPENLSLADTFSRRMNQISVALNSFQFNTVPSHPPLTVGSDVSPEIQAYCIQIIANQPSFETATTEKDYRRLLQHIIRYFLPVWISMAQYLPNVGAADVVMNAYLRDFAENRKVQLHLVIAIMIAVDCAISVVEGGNKSIHEEAGRLCERIFQKVYDTKIYTRAIQLFDDNGFKSEALHCHLELQRHMVASLPMGDIFPWINGEILLAGLRLHFVVGSGLPYCFVQEYTTLLHLYWGLLSQGHVRRMPELEETLVRMYTKNVFFRGGVPKRDSGSYVKSWQLAIGASIHSMKLLDGRQNARRQANVNSKALEMTGLHVTEISRLLDVLQWKTMPIGNKDVAFREIQDIAREESRTIFLAPLVQTCLKLKQLERALTQPELLSSARAFGYRWMKNFESFLPSLKGLSVVAFWGLSLADDRTHEEEKDLGLSMLATTYRSIFIENESDVGEEEFDLKFNPSTHKVDPSFWGEKGVQRSDNLMV